VDETEYRAAVRAAEEAFTAEEEAAAADLAGARARAREAYETRVTQAIAALGAAVTALNHRYNAERTAATAGED
jgi:hypothetical protein